MAIAKAHEECNAYCEGDVHAVTMWTEFDNVEDARDSLSLELERFTNAELVSIRRIDEAVPQPFVLIIGTNMRVRSERIPFSYLVRIRVTEP